MPARFYFECCLCDFRSPYDYFGSKLPRAKSVVLNEKAYVLSDPFTAESEGRHITVGSHCRVCRRGVCPSKRVMTQMFDDIEGTEVIVDDILKWGVDQKQHDERLERVLKRAREQNLNDMKLCDCSIFYTRRFCLPCVKENISEFPVEIQQEVQKKDSASKE